MILHLKYSQNPSYLLRGGQPLRKIGSLYTANPVISKDKAFPLINYPSSNYDKPKELLSPYVPDEPEEIIKNDDKRLKGQTKKWILK